MKKFLNWFSRNWYFVYGSFWAFAFWLSVLWFDSFADLVSFYGVYAAGSVFCCLLFTPFLVVSVYRVIYWLLYLIFKKCYEIDIL